MLQVESRGACWEPPGLGLGSGWQVVTSCISTARWYHSVTLSYPWRSLLPLSPCCFCVRKVKGYSAPVSSVLLFSLLSSYFRTLLGIFSFYSNSVFRGAALNRVLRKNLIRAKFKRNWHPSSDKRAPHGESLFWHQQELGPQKIKSLLSHRFLIWKNGSGLPSVVAASTKCHSFL